MKSSIKYFNFQVIFKKYEKIYKKIELIIKIKNKFKMTFLYA
jgi:hypothetical protein